MNISGKLTEDDSFEFSLEEHGLTAIVIIDAKLMKQMMPASVLLRLVASELRNAAHELTKATLA